jgi:flagellar protein FliO/FliZ
LFGILSHRFMTLFPSLTSVTRWLLVVIGCACLATAQPMSAAPSEAEVEARKNETIIYPRNAAEHPSDAPKNADSGRSLFVVGILLAAAAGALFYLQRRRAGSPLAMGGRKLQIEETRPLGNRQYLIVANYDGKKLLLGVTPGQIQMLTELGERSTEKSS